MFLFYFLTMIIILLWGTEVLDNFGSSVLFPYSCMYPRTPGGGTALLCRAPRHRLNSHQLQPAAPNTSICKGGFVWSLTFPSLSLTGSIFLSIKSHWAGAWLDLCWSQWPQYYLGAFWHTQRYFPKYRRSAQVRPSLCAAYWESRSAW